MNIEQLFEKANQNKFSYVLLLPLGDAMLEAHLESWLKERVNLVKTTYTSTQQLTSMFERADYVLCSVGTLKCVLDTNKPVFVNIHTDDIDITNMENIFVFDPYRNEDKTKIDYTNVLDLAVNCLRKDLDSKWIPYYEV